MKAATRRLGERKLVNGSGRIIDAQKYVTPCRVVDLSNTGARVEVAPQTDVPKQIMLECRGIFRNAETVWRRGGQIGLRFIDAHDAAPPIGKTPLPSAQRLSLEQLRLLARNRR